MSLEVVYFQRSGNIYCFVKGEKRRGPRIDPCETLVSEIQYIQSNSTDPKLFFQNGEKQGLRDTDYYIALAWQICHVAKVCSALGLIPFSKPF